MISLLDKLNKIQEKPESYRRKVAVVIMVILAPFVLMIWFNQFTSNDSLSQKENINENNSYYYEANAENNDSYNPLSVLGEIVGQASSDIKATASTAANELKSVSQEYNKNENEEKTQ